MKGNNKEAPRRISAYFSVIFPAKCLSKLMFYKTYSRKVRLWNRILKHSRGTRRENWVLYESFCWFVFLWMIILYIVSILIPSLIPIYSHVWECKHCKLAICWVFLTRLIIRTSLLFCYFKQMNIHVHNILICSIYAENLYTLLSKMFQGRSKKF